ncbi:MAG: peptidoglycan DD-metalloendopeptidase family protein [Deinococcus-Thermus bacterium]|nr:peptidoglycan DD-metalloendopeptidase family protein [Deinococcota bacterium]
MSRSASLVLLLLVVLVASGAVAQEPPEGANVEAPFVCPPPDEPPPPPQTEEEARERERRARYSEVFPLYVAAAGPEPDTRLVVPVDGVRVSQIADTWGGPRSGGRRHEGQDLFAPRGTPVRSATDGWVWRIGERTLGGRTVTIVGGAGRRYYYAHLSSYADIREGQRVTPDTVIGYVGNTGNARATPPHLHLGVYESRDPEDPCDWDAIDPLPMLVDRD